MQGTDFESSDASFDSTYTSPSSRYASLPQGRRGARRARAGSIHYSQFEGASASHGSFQAAFDPREGRSVSGSQTVSASQPSSEAFSRTASSSTAYKPQLNPSGSASADGFDDVDPFWDH